MTSITDRTNAARQLIPRLRERYAAFDLAMSVIKKGGRDGIGRLSAVVSYFSFFSIFPLLLVFVSIIGMMADGSWRSRIKDSVLANFPVIGDQILANAGTGTLTGSPITAVVAGVAALWSGSHAFDALEYTIHAVSNTSSEQTLGFLKRRLRALALLGVFGTGLLVTAAAGGIVAAVDLPGVVVPLGFVVTAMANALLLGVMFAVAIPGHDNWRRLAPGAVLGGIGLTVLHAGGGWFLNRVVTKASATYGSIAFVIGLLTWVKLTVTVVLWSAELNSVLADRAIVATDGEVVDGA